MSDRNQNSLKSEDWRRHWERWKTSGLSQAEYARHEQINLHRLRYWIGKFNHPASSSRSTALVKVPLRAQMTAGAPLELVVENKYRLIIRTGFDSNLLQAVLSSLEGRS